MPNPKLKQIIEDLAIKYCEKPMDWDGFHDSIVGVYGKERCPLSSSECNKHTEELLQRQGIFTEVSEYENFLKVDHDIPLGSNIRFYMNAHDAESAREIVKAVVKELEGQRFKIKTVWHDEDGYTRFDNTVLYVNRNENIRRVAEFLQRLPESLFDEDVPFTVKKIARGIGYALSTLYVQRTVLGHDLGCRKFIFNELHSTVLKILFGEFVKRGISDLDEMTELYIEALKGAHLNPEKPYLNLGIEDPLDGMKK